uniref:Uncharacterized protein n=1 Tax=Salmo trutta TaxID=8032 RepID=A0A674BCK8_SALTR
IEEIGETTHTVAKSTRDNVQDQCSNATGDLKKNKNPQVTENIHKQLRQYLQRTLQGGATVQTGSAEQAAKNSQDPAWGVPEQDLCSFVMPYYLKQEQENAVLAQRVQAGREGINQTEQRIATAVEGECNRRHCASLAASLPPSTCL